MLLPGDGGDQDVNDMKLDLTSRLHKVGIDLYKMAMPKVDYTDYMTNHRELWDFWGSVWSADT